LDEQTANLKACVNIKNEDRYCFKYSVQCGIYEIFNKKNPQDMYHYKNLNDNIDWSETEDMSLSNIDKFERKIILQLK
jgi:hypothetical protein